MTKKVLPPKNFVGLHGHSTFSIGDGLGRPQEHMDYAFNHGQDAIALTDHGNMNGFSHQYLHGEAMKKKGMDFKPIYGIEAYFVPSLDNWLSLYQTDRDEKEQAKNLKKKKARNRENTVEEDLIEQGLAPEAADSDMQGDAGIENEEESKNARWKNPLYQRNHLVLLAKNSEGLKSLFNMISLSYKDGFYRYPRMDFDMLKKFANGNIVATTACVAGTPSKIIFDNQTNFTNFYGDDGVFPLNDNYNKIQNELSELVDRFHDALGPENFYLEMQFNKLNCQHLVNRHLIDCSKRTGAKLVVTCDSHYSDPGHWREREIYRAMSQLQIMKKSPEELEESLPKNIDELKCELYPKNADQVWETYKETTEKFDFYDDLEVREAIQRSYEIAHDQIGEVTMDRRVKLPVMKKIIGEEQLEQLLSEADEDDKKDEDQLAFNQLKKDAIKGAIWRKVADKQEYIERLKYELSVVKKLKFSKYFITYEKIMEIAEKEMLIGNARGSAGGSLLAYVLNITQMDPIKHDLLFARFLTMKKTSFPDIDSDFSDRERAVNLLTEYFGDEDVVSVSNFNQLQLKSLIKDNCKLNGIPFNEINEYTKKIEIEALAAAKREPGFDMQQWELTFEEAESNSVTFRELMAKYPDLERTIKILFKQMKAVSRHAGGVIITDNASNNMPIIKSGGVLQTPWQEGLNFRHLEGFGFLKFDILGLGTLRMFENCIRRIIKKRDNKTYVSFDEVREFFYNELHPDNNDMDDLTVYKNVYWNSNYAGIFQFVQKNVQDFMAKMKPNSIVDIAVATSIHRPGPLSIGADKLYLKNRANPSSIRYKHPLLEEVLAPTAGLIIFQEQLQLIYHKLAGVPLEDTDDIRKALLKKDKSNKEKAEKELQRLKQDFMDRCLEANDIPLAVSEDIFDEMMLFVSYSFNKCLSGESVVLTRERGEIKIKDVVVGEHVDSKNGFVKVKNLYENGVKKLYKIKTENGNELVCTLDHKLETFHGMKPLKEILDNTCEYLLVCAGDNEGCDEILEHEYVGEEETYDLEVEHEDHTFFANNISVSNSHASAYAITSYQCSHLLTYYPDEWIASYIDYCVMDKGKAAGKEDPKVTALAEAKALNYKIGKPDINYSLMQIETNDNIIVPSFATLKSVGAAAFTEIEQFKPYKTVEDLLWNPDGTWRHSKFNKRALSTLIKLESFDSMNIVGEGRTFENYNQMHYVLVDNGDLLKRECSKKKKQHKQLLARLVEESKEVEDWELREKVAFNKELGGSVDNDMIVTPEIREYFNKANITSIDDWSNEKELYWAIVQSSKIATTKKTGKSYCRVGLTGESGQSQNCFFWNFNPSKDALLPENILIIGSFRKSDFGLSSFYGKIEVLEKKK